MVGLQLAANDKQQIEEKVCNSPHLQPKQKEYFIHLLQKNSISHKKLVEIVAALRKTEDNIPTIRQLVVNSVWQFPIVKGTCDSYERPPELEKRLEMLRTQQESKRYREMVKDVDPRIRQETADSSQLPFHSFREQLALGLQVMISMATGFIFGYYIGWKITKSNTWALINGLVFFILAMFVDVILIITGIVSKEMMNSKQSRYRKK
eukprot:jgi/Galph1/1360/GphlegSOOS_G6010.1